MASTDVVYIAASSHDARFTRIAVASIRMFHPDIPIRLLSGGRVSRRLLRELRRYWNVDVAAIPAGDYGWGFVKLEPLFGPPGERFLVLDSDTILTGPLLDIWTSDAPFLVDDEQQTEADTRRLYFDWDKLRAIDPAAERPAFVFNSGQWFGTAGLLSRDDFTPWIEWTMPRRLRHPGSFMPGDQGVLNYVLNQRSAFRAISVQRSPIMRWPAHGMVGLTAAMVRAGTAPALVVHWAGLKRARMSGMPGGDLLLSFERCYYACLPGGSARRVAAAATHVGAALRRAVVVRATLSYRRWFRTKAARS